MAIKIIGSTIIDDSRNIVNAGIATVTSVSIGNTQVVSSARQLQNIASLDATTTATIEAAIANAPNTFTDLNVSGISTLGVTSTTNLTAQQLNVSGVSTVGFLTATNIWNAGITTSSRVIVTAPQNTADGGGQIYLNGAGNRIDFNTSGVAAPAFTTRSAGTKIVLYPNVTGSAVDYGFGVETGGVWYSVATTGGFHRWYAATTQLADLKGTGELVIGSTSLTGTSSQRLQVTGGAYVSGSVGIGTTNPGTNLHIASGAPSILFTENDAAANNKNWLLIANSQEFYLQAQTDAPSGGGNIFKFTRSAEQIQTFEGQNGGNTWFVVNNNTQRVGVGTTNPNALLEVYTANTDANSVNSLVYEGSGAWMRLGDASTARTFTNGIGIKFHDQGNQHYSIGQINGNFLIANTSANGAQLFPSTTNTVGILLNSSGNVGINTTNPASTLTVQGDARVSGVVTATTFVGALTGTATTATLATNVVGSTNRIPYNNGTNTTTTSSNFTYDGSTFSVGFGSTYVAIAGDSGRNIEIGVGSTNLTTYIDLHGADDVYSDYATRISRSSGANNVFQIVNRGNGGIQLSAGQTAGETGTIQLVTANTEALRIDSSQRIGINSTSPTSRLDVVGDAKVSGVITATTFSGQVNVGVGTITTLSGTTATYTTLNSATGNINTGIITTLSGTNLSYSGIGTIGTLGVSGVTTTQHLSVTGVSTYTGISTFQSSLFGTQASFTGVVTASSFTGSGANLTSLNATQLTSGTVPAARITAAANDFTVGNNLYVNGTLSVGGTSIILNAQQLTITDRDIVVGYTTNASNQDISTDTTAIHGGIAVASTEGSPLINIPLAAGINSNPTTYKQFMWIGGPQRTTYLSGFGTDSWLTNYPISIGTTIIQNNSRFNVGVGFTVYDTYLDATDIRARNLNVSGVVTATTFVGALTGTATTATNVIGGIGSITQLQVTGISTFTNGPVLVGTTTSTGTANQLLQVTGGAYIAGDSNSAGLGIGNTNPFYVLDIRLNAAGAATPTIRISPTTQTNAAGILYANTASSNFYTGLLNSAGSIGALSGLTPYAAIVGLSTGINPNPLLFVTNALERARIHSTGEVGIGTTTLTGTSSQALQVNSGAYVSGLVGLADTNPLARLSVATNGKSISDGNVPVQVSTQSASGQIYYGANNNGSYGVLFGYDRAAYTGGVIRVVGASDNIEFVVNNTTRAATITSAGSVGIGTTNPSVAANRLSVSNPSGGTMFSLNDGGTTNRKELIFTLDTTNNVARIESLQQGIAYRSLLLNSNGGNIGIGTDNPRSTFQVKDALAFETTNTTTTSTTQVAVDTFATATFRSAKYQAQITCPGQISVLGGITTGGRGYTAGTFNVTFTTSSGNGSAAQGTLVVSNGTVGQISVSAGGTGYVAGDVLTATGGSGLQVSVGTTSATGAILTLGSITSAGIGYTGYYNATTGTGTTSLTFLGGTGTGAVGLATIFDGVITSSTLLQQPTTGTGGTTYYSGSNYSTASVLSITRSDLTNTITTITGSVGVSTFTSLTAHGIGVSDVVRVSSTSNGLTAGVDYYVVTVPSTTTFTLGSSVGVGTTFTTGSSLSIGFYRNSSRDGGQVAYTNAISGVSTNYQVSDLMVLQNGTTADFIEYATIANNDVLGTFAADISGANARLLFTPTYPDNTIKVARQAITL